MIAIIVTISIMMDKSPLIFITGIGAAATVLVIVFKESLQGFLASIQMASYDMIRIGDWIHMPNYLADGYVKEISISTVKVQNFDRTITTIPSFALLNEGVKNWRGMEEAGALTQ